MRFGGEFVKLPDHRRPHLFLRPAVSALARGASSAQERHGRPWSLELNAAQPSQKGCRLTFVVANNLGKDLSKAAFEIALFNELGVVDTLTVLDFKELPSGKTKVVALRPAGYDCAKVSRVLVNRATECVGDGVDPAACMRQLAPSTKATSPSDFDLGAWLSVVCRCCAYAAMRNLVEQSPEADRHESIIIPRPCRRPTATDCIQIC